MQKEYVLEQLRKKDYFTYIHSINVGRLMYSFAIELGKNVGEAKIWQQAGELHDAGKLFVATNILTSEKALTEKERRHMNSHVQYGRMVIESVKGYTQTDLDCSMYHHLHWNGGGYRYHDPSHEDKRLHGNMIPEAAQACAICDVWDALTSERPYKRAYSYGEASEVMYNNALLGTFNPAMYNLFMGKVAMTDYIWNHNLAIG